MKYRIIDDINITCTILGMSPSQLANELNVARSTINRILNGKTEPSDLFLDNFYRFVYWNKYENIKINDLKIQFAKDNYDYILFHGSKKEIVDNVSLDYSRTNVDFGRGFYLGESYEQAASYVFNFPKSSVYLFDARKLKKLKTIELNVSLEWIIAICYYRGQIEKYKNSVIVKKVIDEIEKTDVVIAPIADNNMYETMEQFARGRITDKQAMLALSASNLGKQHVLKTERACKSIICVDRLYLATNERIDIESKTYSIAQTALNKSKISIEMHRREGKYIEELLND